MTPAVVNVQLVAPAPHEVQVPLNKLNPLLHVAAVILAVVVAVHAEAPVPHGTQVAIPLTVSKTYPEVQPVTAT